MAEHKKSVCIGGDVRLLDSAAKAAKAQERENQFKASWRVGPRYEIRKLLGSGAYGAVAEAKDLEKKRKVAIKQVGHLLDDLTDGKRVLREICILGKLNHPFIVKCYDVMVPNDKRFNELYAVLEIADSDLRKLIKTDMQLSQAHVHTLLYNLLVGLNFLHSAGIWHRDLKPANVLVNEDCTVRICDFGLARAVGVVPISFEAQDNAERRTLTGHVVTRWYRAPELILLQENYTEAIDMWSVGCIFAELILLQENYTEAIDMWSVGCIFAELIELIGRKLKERQVLFPGHTCFPLSPHAGHQNDTKYYTRGTRDQLSMIFGLLGNPSENDIKELEGDDAQCYVRCFPRRQPTGLDERFGTLDREGTELLGRMLVFSSSKRISVAEALEHPIFAKIRDKKLEFKAPEPITLDFEKEEELDEQALRRLFLAEVQRLQPMLSI